MKKIKESRKVFLETKIIIIKIDVIVHLISPNWSKDC